MRKQNKVGRVLAIALAASMMLGVTGCGNSQSSQEAATTAAETVKEIEAEKEETTETATEAAKEETEAAKEETAPKELMTVCVAFPPAVGNLFQFIAEEHDIFKEEGIQVEVTPIGNSTDAYTAIDAGQVDFGIYGTSGPLFNIASGRDFTIFGGYMITGATPFVAKAGTEYKGLESFRGKTVAVMRFTSPDAVLRTVLYDAGFDLEKDVKIVEFKKPSEVLEAVRSGQADFGGLPTGEETSAEAYGLETMVYTDEMWPLHSCCRLTANSAWLKEQPEAAKALLRSYLRAAEILETMSDEEIVSLTAEKLEIEEERAAKFIVNEHLLLDIDPYKNVVLKMWNRIDDVYSDIDTSSVDIEEHINTELYKEALDELTERYPDNAFYQERQEIFAEYDQ